MIIDNHNEKKVIDNIYIVIYTSKDENEDDVQTIKSYITKSKLDTYIHIIMNNIELYDIYFRYLKYQREDKIEIKNLIDEIEKNFYENNSYDENEIEPNTTIYWTYENIFIEYMEKYHDKDNYHSTVEINYDKYIDKILDVIKSSTLEDYEDFEKYINEEFDNCLTKFSILKLSDTLNFLEKSFDKKIL